MTERAKAILDAFCELSRAEQDKVIACLMGIRDSNHDRVASPEVSARFKQAAAEVFTTNEDLVKKLAN